jgi:Spy/CpxP family protein refolding chaperone
MRRTTLISGLYLAVGAFGLRLYTLNSVNAGVNPRDPEVFRRRYVAEMSSRLKLTDDQVGRLGPILDEARRQHQELVDKHRPEFKAIHDEQVSKIRAILTPGQQAEYTKMLEDREKQRQREGKR